MICNYLYTRFSKLCNGGGQKLQEKKNTKARLVAFAAFLGVSTSLRNSFRNTSFFLSSSFLYPSHSFFWLHGNSFSFFLFFFVEKRVVFSEATVTAK